MFRVSKNAPPLAPKDVRSGETEGYAPRDGQSIMTTGGYQDMTMANPNLVVHRDPEILGGTPVFAGTRVPIKILFDYLEAGDSLEVFLDEFPSVTRAQAVAAPELAREVLAPDAHPA